MDIKLGIVIIALIFLCIALVRYRKSIVLPIAIALIISAVWTTIYRYEYMDENIFLFGRVNIYPLVLWTCGLTGLSILYTRITRKTHFALVTLAYLILLFALEAVGYHLLHIRLASNFPSLWNTGVIHGPPFLKIFYIMAGPTYLVLIYTLQKILSKR